MKVLSILTCLSLSFCCLAESLKDPTRPPNWNENMVIANIPKGIVLTAIFSSANQSFANINGNLVKIGDQVLEYEVTRIDPNAVYLKNKEGLFMVPLTTNIKTATGNN